MKKQRVFLLVLDSVGIGLASDAQKFGDEGSNTLKTISNSPNFNIPNLTKMGIGNIDKIDFLESVKSPCASFARLCEASNGKDTTVGHWEIAGVISHTPLPTYKDGFPPEIINTFKELVGVDVLCNKPYSGTKVLEDYGDEHIKTGNLIVYTSADSVFQIAAHEDVFPLEKLYYACEKAREILKGEHGVGRVIARPFTGNSNNFKRTSNRHDYSLLPHKRTMLDILKDNKFDVISIGKIADIFANSGITQSISTISNKDGMDKMIDALKMDFNGICFINLVDFDMMFGHRNDIDGYATALSEFDSFLGSFLPQLRDDDLFIITADHGCDPGFDTTDHSRENVPMLVYSKSISPKNLGTKTTFACIGKTILSYFSLPNTLDGSSFLSELI